MNYYIFDTHAHYDDEAFNEDRDSLVRSLTENGIRKVVNIGASMESSRTTFALAKQYEHIYAAVGVHPDCVMDLSEADMQELKAMTGDPKVLAIGECGLDYYWHTDNKDVQKQWFERQLELSKEVDLPVVIHSRDAAKDTYDIVKATRTGDGAGIVHCFSYSKEMAKQFLDLGYYIALGGVVTFKNGKTAKEVAAYVPEDRLLLETDSPYLTPVPFRGKRNSSLNLPYVVKAIAEIRGISEEKVIELTCQNACRLYKVQL